MSDLAHIDGVVLPKHLGSTELYVVAGTEQTAEPVAAPGPESHITYHPVSSAMVERYAYYVYAEGGADLAAQHGDAMGMGLAYRDHFVSLLAHFAATGDQPFDRSHGFNIALTQGFFGTYFYVFDARLSSLGELIAPYCTTWDQVLPDWPTAATAANRLQGEYSSGTFLRADAVAQFMHDAHANPELTQALATHFPGSKLTVLWSALQAAVDEGAGLVEAAGVLVPDRHDLSATTCLARYDQCDAASLHAYYAEPIPEPAAPAYQLPVPAHMADHPVHHAGERLPGTPSLTERLRAKRGEL